jgi:hypothetical protein
MLRCRLGRRPGCASFSSESAPQTNPAVRPLSALIVRPAAAAAEHATLCCAANVKVGTRTRIRLWSDQDTIGCQVTGKKRERFVVGPRDS